MLETKFKVLFLLAILAFAAIPIMGIMRGSPLTPFEGSSTDSTNATSTATIDPSQVSHEEPVPEEMVSIPAGPFIRGTNEGGLDERPQRTVLLDAFAIDRYEVTNHQYQQFVDVTGHRKSGPPARYAKNMSKMLSINQPVVYVSWEKAMRGSDGRLWPWGNVEQPNGANWARVQDGHEVSAIVGTVQTDKSPYGVMDGAGNVMEWVADWYGERYFTEAPEQNPPSPDHGVYRVLRGGGYATTGADIRITSRSKMVADFRDETIGFRCAVSGEKPGRN
jgi:formylglycine-generating enzyme required for sulfatase activity